MMHAKVFAKYENDYYFVKLDEKGNEQPNITVRCSWPALLNINDIVDVEDNFFED